MVFFLGMDFARDPLEPLEFRSSPGPDLQCRTECSMVRAAREGYG